MSNKPGLNLADLAPMYEDVPYGESFLRVHGIAAEQGVAVFQRFPKIVGMVTGDGFNLATFVAVAPAAVAAIIATACGASGDDTAEENAARLPLDVQMEIMEAIGRLTFSKGFAPFAEKVMGLANGAKSGRFSKVPDMKSPHVSKGSSQPDIPPQ